MFEEEDSDHLVGEGHLREGEFGVGALQDRVVEAEGAADDEGEVGGFGEPFGELCGKFC